MDSSNYYEWFHRLVDDVKKIVDTIVNRYKPKIVVIWMNYPDHSITDIQVLQEYVDNYLEANSVWDNVLDEIYSKVKELESIYGSEIIRKLMKDMFEKKGVKYDECFNDYF